MSSTLTQSILSLNTITSALKSVTSGGSDSSVTQLQNTLAQITSVVTNLQNEGKEFVTSTTEALSNIKPEDATKPSTYSDLLKENVANFSATVDSAIQTIAPLKDSVASSGNLLQNTISGLTSQLTSLQGTLAGNQASLDKAQKSYSLLSGLGALGGLSGLAGALELVKKWQSVLAGNQQTFQDLQTTLAEKTKLVDLVGSANGSTADIYNILPGLSTILHFLQNDLVSQIANINEDSAAAAVPVIVSTITGALSEISGSLS
ncbi:hypothetical protein [Kalamiella sp. sgz302252]|uniref:hypothetical protein n=1 Tax=Pantoea sp. sgz302252 TaxID=3341827 RepID=UPI0036D265EC